MSRRSLGFTCVEILAMLKHIDIVTHTHTRSDLSALVLFAERGNKCCCSRTFIKLTSHVLGMS